MTFTELLEGSSSTSSSPPRQDWHHSDRIKRESRHIYNKLHSISHDSAFIHRIHALFPSLLLTANLRCGAWYTDPAITSAVSYFKSTDGHTHQWSFSLKRSNLHLVPLIVDAGGAIVVDSTRRGKSIPDALSKTIPVWCAVLNGASRRRYGCPAEDAEGFVLETPQWMIPPSEHDQIESRIEGFVESLLDSDLQVPMLKKPLKPVFVTPQTNLESIPEQSIQSTHCRFTPMLLVSASRFVSDSARLGDSSSADASQAKETFIYVQGAGDDHENWARSLTPDVFWQHHDQLLACDKEQLEALVDSIVAEEASSGSGKNGHWFTPLRQARCATDDAQLGGAVASASANGADTEVGATRVFIGSRAADHTFSAGEKEQYDLIIHFTSTSPPPASASTELTESLSSLQLSPDSKPTPKVLTLHMSPNKKGLSSIRTVFPPAIERARHTLSASDSNILVCCESGKDVSGSLVVAILASCFTDQRQLIVDEQAYAAHSEEISKDTTGRRLQWLVSACPRAAPSRAFLLRVNELLISPRHQPANST
ncbi:related to RIT1-initiator tRNA phosphoribosyl-transferase [Sporisorium reilianum SRZ2]|uniref:Related to RIT1-initiator tRNA phosphoribosyl-transferase n=1 Tax=Sporisorium reilianum (strain SRZ2) TaxID=999809 RepID=E6ZXK3_SPORE|nr:related to RIT1-initiator tRNA phosphoribosyl-transferase [Sporisorium reilianum SRZ2]